MLIMKKEKRNDGLKRLEEIKKGDRESEEEAGSGNGEEEGDSSMSVCDEDSEPARVSVGDDIVSEVDLRQAFIMTSNVTKQGNRRKKILSQLPKNAKSTNSTSGLLALHFDHISSLKSTNHEVRQVSRVICYGTFPWLPQPLQKVFKIFSGPNAPALFIVWLLQNVMNYQKDARQQSRFVNVFTIKGSTKMLPEVLRALVSIVGRDAHFIGDINKVKLVWYENVRFFDLSNYFDGCNLK